MVCENPKSPWLLRVDESERRVYWFRADCKLWSCPECAEIRKTRVASRAFRGAEYFAKVGYRVQFTTLTCHRNVRSRDESIERWRECWPRLRKRVARRCDEFHYGVFPEQHKDGTMHVHVLETSGLEERVYKDHCAAIGLGFMCDVQSMANPGKVAKYVTKYMAKAIEITDWPNGFHRFRYSRQWPDADSVDTPEIEWSVYVSLPAFDDELRYWQKQRFSIVNTRTGEVGHG